MSVKAQIQRSASSNALAGWVVAIAIAFMWAARAAWMPTGASSITEKIGFKAPSL
ncbi:MAG: hypothetical protein F6K56_33775 [Moorea sp. SIO3G5]|nr:hypothetical protein [Moorena sp. SIO3G5]